MSDREQLRREASARARARQARVAVAVPARPAREWTCTGCGHVGPWDAGWRWFGYYRLTGRGSSAGETAGETAVIEAVACPSCPAEILPAPVAEAAPDAGAGSMPRAQSPGETHEENDARSDFP